MAITKTIQATVKNRTDTAANWTQKNPVLAEGEIIVVQTSAGETRLKIGDGVKTFTQLPYTDEQIYNNVVTSVNGQTGDITMNSVEYTSQTLTDAQKKQARDNIDAAIADFVVNGTVNQSGIVTLDKTLVQIIEAANSGKNVFAHITFGNYIAFMPLTQIDSGIAKFAIAGNDNLNVMAVELIVNTNVNALNINRSPGLNSNRDMLQISMASDPTEAMQIATKKYVDDSTFNTVLYTAQTLTDEQRKQARDNIEAAANDFVINATLADNDNCTTDKTYTQIQEAVQAGKKVVVKIRAYGFDFVLPLIGKFESDYMFTAVFNPTNTVAMQFAVVIGEQGSGIFKCRIPTYNSDGNSLQQVTMEADPTSPMQIATKKYVDGKISDKEIILSSSTAGSTKKFKLTIDDTGTLTASEITA